MFKGIWALGTAGTLMVAAFSSSSSYKLQNYGVGAGGTNSSSSTSYTLNASSGEVGGAAGSGSTKGDKPGSIEAQQANVPAAPTLSNGGGTFYNKLQLTINTTGSDASDYSYSIAVSTNNFTTTSYVQADGTLAATAAYQSYSAWGGGNGSYMTGLSPATTYQVKVNARQGLFTASAYGPQAAVATVNPALTFSISQNTVNLNSLTPGSVITSSGVGFGFATNAAAGGAVYVAGLNNGLKSVGASYTIPAGSVDLSTQSQGFGLLGQSPTQTSGGPLSLKSPFNGSGNVVGAETTNFQQLFATPAAITGGSATAYIKGKAAATTPSGTDYTETFTFIASASF